MGGVQTTPAAMKTMERSDHKVDIKEITQSSTLDNTSEAQLPHSRKTKAKPVYFRLILVRATNTNTTFEYLGRVSHTQEE